MKLLSNISQWSDLIIAQLNLPQKDHRGADQHKRNLPLNHKRGQPLKLEAYVEAFAPGVTNHQLILSFSVQFVM